MTPTSKPTKDTTQSSRKIGGILAAPEPKASFRDLDGKTRKFLLSSLVTLFTTAVLFVYLLPLGYMAMTSVKSEDQIAQSTILPKSATTIQYAYREFDLVEVTDLDGSIQAFTVSQAGSGDAGSDKLAWTGTWDELFAKITSTGANPSDVSLYEVGSAGRSVSSLSIVMPTGDPSSLLSGNVPEELPFDQTEDSLLAALDATGYGLGDVALFAMPRNEGNVPALSLLRPGAAVNALVDPALLPSLLDWDGSYAGLEAVAQAELGVDAQDLKLFTVPDADGTIKGLGILPPESDATVFLDPAITPPLPVDFDASAESLQATLDERFDVTAEELELFVVPLEDGTSPTLGLLNRGADSSAFIDPQNPTGEPIVWEGRVQTLQPILELDPTLSNFPDAWDSIGFVNKIRNTAIIAGLGMGGVVVASTFVAYGLSRFRIPYKNLILGSLVATIILPRFVTLVPTYLVFERIGWIGTWWPLIIPHFFGNAYNVFLLRQFFLTIPRDMDEAAAIDGASPFMTLVTVILPQAKGAILAVALFHFFFSWNDFLEPLLYLSTEPDKQPISVGLYFFLGLYDANIPLIQSGALLGMAIPVVVFLLLQKVFLSGIDLSGSSK